MICIELTFTESPDRLAARPAHHELLKALHTEGLLIAAGPWDDDSGALILLNTDHDGAAAVMAADPYYTTAGVHVASVRTWQPAVGGEQFR